MKCQNAPRAVKMRPGDHQKILFVLSVKVKKFGVANNVKEI